MNVLSIQSHVAYGHAGIDPKIMGLGPVSAVKRALARANLLPVQRPCPGGNESLNPVRACWCRCVSYAA